MKRIDEKIEKYLKEESPQSLAKNMQYDIEHAIMDALVKQYEDGYFDLSNDDEVIKALSMVIKKLKPRNLWNVLNISAGE